MIKAVMPGKRNIILLLGGVLFVLMLLWFYLYRSSSDEHQSGFGQLLAPISDQHAQTKMWLMGNDKVVTVMINAIEPVQAVDLELRYDPEQTKVNEVLLTDKYSYKIVAQDFTNVGALRYAVGVGPGREGSVGINPLLVIDYDGQDTFEIDEDKVIVASFGRELLVVYD